MSRYLSLSLVEQAFRRLLSRRRDGKTHLERTSVLMYFLAFEAACHKLDKSLLDLDPDKTDGKNNRKQIEIEFINLVLIDDRKGYVKQVLELGKIDEGDKHPEKRISSNFLTVPLKKASESARPYFYPKRPASPLLRMGHAATGLKWGMQRHESWAQNIPILFSEIKESTPFLDIAIFSLRHSPIDGATDDLLIALKEGLNKKFTKELASFWGAMIEKEKLLARHITKDLFSPTYQPFISLSRKNESQEIKMRLSIYDKDALMKRILDLESLLDLNNIKYEKKF